MFFTFRQNNSGGLYTGPAVYVIVEAPNVDAACNLAEAHGVYFDGCSTDKDCPCCGDRWSRPWDPGTPEPLIYGEPAWDSVPDCEEGGLSPLLIVFADGTTQWEKPRVRTPLADRHLPGDLQYDPSAVTITWSGATAAVVQDAEEAKTSSENKA